ncbi:CDP-diacylglycerol--serine O-phosphatidyltransferase [Rhodococcus triatomae]|uniref:CDP-diacylglycerol--serine O-phosphatidyltransferase n=1 Tax=Rhodococcus triatomae TaxID=300028 RepID=A0A1G8NB18_9NOCA|nr:CDP-diacylglycerol--serine O-phosphatidyltransferase [Rhodococcus triatomae]QNG19954.1 CDP-diacylglycerol--serine O-phosphatidyltransferase [Rhodococcus triatomae]QNG24131.1 CDP-diacylglycerol--serine O-phosphatidyltransferase [Rhodococcus triatomae]SDI77333.1 CDP-diacylglycerol---serine O-phosphatidyltransferase [Rhodococcus triatomae]
MTTDPKKRRRPVRLLPSVITVLALCGGLSAVKFALDGEIGIAIAMIGAAAILDSLDGRLARLLDATSRIGAELDSLADAISFGVAPALVLYVTLLDGQSYGWITALVYVVCIVLRLARFNTLLDDDDVPGYAREYFVGVPAPAAALVAVAPLAAAAQWGDGWWTSYPVVAAWIVGAAALAVSRIPTLAMKTVSVPSHMVAGLLVLVALLAAALITYPFVLVIFLVAVYLVHIPFAVRSQRWVAARPETWDIKPAERRAIRRRPDPESRRSAARLGLRRPGGGR